MIDVSKLPEHVIEDIAANLGWTKPEFRGDGPAHAKDKIDIEPFKRRIASMTPRDAFVAFCTWHGLIGWGPLLISAIDSLRAAETLADPESLRVTRISKSDR